MQLRQLCCDPRLLFEDYRAAHGAKLDAIMELVASAMEGWREGAHLQPVHQLFGPDRATPQGGGHRLLHHHGAHAQEGPRGAGERVQRQRRPRVPGVAQGRRHGIEPHGRERGHPRRPLVERRGAAAGHRPRSPHRPDTRGKRAEGHRERHHRGAHPAPAGGEEQAGRPGDRLERHLACQLKRRRPDGPAGRVDFAP